MYQWMKRRRQPRTYSEFLIAELARRIEVDPERSIHGNHSNDMAWIRSTR